MRYALTLVLAIAGTLAFITPAAAGVRTCKAAGLDPRFDATIDPVDINQDLFDAAVLYYVNIERCAHGLGALRADATLKKATAPHSTHMAQNRYLSHKSRAAGLRQLSDRLNRAHVSYKVAGENIAKSFVFAFSKSPIGGDAARCDFRYSANGSRVPRHSYATMAKDLVGLWMDSPSHRRNILHPAFHRAGATASVDTSEYCGTIYAAQNFAN